LDADPADKGVDASVLQFAESVSPEIRERTERALARAQAVAGETIEDEVTFRVIDLDLESLAPTFSGTESIIAKATHREEPPAGFPGEFGRYSAGSEDIWLLSPQTVDQLVDLLEEETPVDLSEFSFEGFPDGPIIAHELAHAIQYDVAAVERGGPAEDDWQGGQTVVEGTAEYVAGIYRAHCNDGTFEDCRPLEYWVSATQTPLWGLYQRLPYINGMVLAHRILSRHGWENLWSYHEDSPKTAWAGMFPETYLDSGITITMPTQPSLDTDSWNRVESDRLGVTALYEKLAYLGAVSPTDSEAQLEGSITELAAIKSMYRTALLEEWRGDEFRGYERGNYEEIAYRWRVNFRSKRASSEFVTAVAAGYDRRGSPEGATWNLDGGAAAVDQDGSAVVLSWTPTASALEQIRGPLV
jgi:hypothetical protein